MLAGSTRCPQYFLAAHAALMNLCMQLIHSPAFFEAALQKLFADLKCGQGQQVIYGPLLCSAVSLSIYNWCDVVNMRTLPVFAQKLFRKTIFFTNYCTETCIMYFLTDTRSYNLHNLYRKKVNTLFYENWRDLSILRSCHIGHVMLVGCGCPLPYQLGSWPTCIEGVTFGKVGLMHDPETSRECDQFVTH